MEGSESGDKLITPAVSNEDPSSLLVAVGMKAFRYCPVRLYFSPLVLESSPTSTAVGEDALYAAPQIPITSFVQVLIEPFQKSSDLPTVFGDIINTLFASPTLQEADLDKNGTSFG